MDSADLIREEVRSQKRVLAAAYILRVYLSINSLGFTVSLPTIMKDFGALDFYPVLMVLNTASMAILALVGGKLIDMIGVKRMTVFAAAGVSVAAAFAAFAPNLPVFVVFYVCMAACHGIGISMPVAMICDVTHSEERSRYMGLYSAANNLGLLVGPLLGGFVTDHFGYHITPLYPLIMPAAVLYLVIRYYPAVKQKADLRGLDLPGSLLSALTIASFIVVLNIGGKYFPWSSPVVWGTAAAFAVFLISFLLWEKRSAHPLLNLRLFRIPSFSVGVAMVLLGMPSINLAANYVTLFVQSGMGYSATFSGTFALPKTLFVLLVTVVLGGWISRRAHQHKMFLILGGCITAASSVLLYFGTQGPHLVSIIVLYLVTSLYGVGEGLCYMTTHPYYQKDIPEEDIGSGISVQTLCTTMGATLSATSYGAVLNGFGGDVAVAFPYMGLVVVAATAVYLLLGIFFVRFGPAEK